MKWGDKLADKIRNWLQINPPYAGHMLPIRGSTTMDEEIIRNRVWYRGDSDELLQLYERDSRTDASSSRFWAAVPAGRKIRKIHSGLPGMMVDTLVGIVSGDFDGIDFDDVTTASRFEEINRSVHLSDQMTDALTECLITGDGAFKLSWDKALSEHPIVDFYGADRVEYHYTRNLLTGISFYTNFNGQDQVYQLEEIYSAGSIRYALRNHKGITVPLDTVPELRDYKNIELPNNLMAAVPLTLFRGGRWPHRGRSLFAGKTDTFDALDEVISQWIDAIRAGRVIKYIPENMIPRDKNTGALQMPDSFGGEYVKVAGTMDAEKSDGKIDLKQPDIRYDAFLASYTATLDMCLQGVLSPATLGIGIAKTASGEAQRERKDITGFTRNTITAVLERALPKLATVILQLDDYISGKSIGTYNPTVSFGEYASPDFASRAKAVQSAAASGAMSIEATVEELWGGSKGDDWIADEIARIKKERGVAEVSEPSAADELP